MGRCRSDTITAQTMLKLASKIRIGTGIATTLAIAVNLGNEQAPALDKANSAHYQPVVQDMHGWTVHVDPALLEGQESVQGKRALSMLANHLERISLLLTGKQLQDMRQLELWIEHRHQTLQNMQYHPSAAWLRNHDCDIRLAKKVHIPIASHLLSREQLLKHPAVVLHELSHAYHDQVLGFDEERVFNAFKEARDSDVYKRTMSHRGKTVRHYALSNHKEYFAEGTEAFFYRNDFYPFVRAELKQADPKLHDLLQQIWER
jgi:dipeptidyl-peptidase-4